MLGRRAAPQALTRRPAPPPPQPVREVVRPANQLQLGEKELGEEVARSLSANNPAAPANLVRYSLKDRAYRAEPLIGQLLQHFQLAGCLASRSAEEAAAREQHRRESVAASRRATAVGSRRVTEAAGAGVGAPGGDAAELQASSSSLGPDARRLRNQFNSVDRGAQTGHQPPKDRQTMTEAPPTATAGGSCSKWEIYNAYVEDHERQKQQEEIAKQRALVARKGGAAGSVQVQVGGRPEQVGGAGGGAAWLFHMAQAWVFTQCSLSCTRAQRRSEEQQPTGWAKNECCGG